MSHHAKRRRPRPAPATFPSFAAWREAHDLNQREAAEVLGFSQSTYSRFERGAAVAKGKEAKRLHVTTGVALEVIVGVA
jgi:transcriptional regulator with XRE-family HTH domain